MSNNKVFILLPDGIGLRNFAYTNFYEIGIQNKFDITYWNSTPFNLSDLGYNEIKLNSSPHPLTNILKRVRTQIDLNLNIKKTKDNVYDSYRFKSSYHDFKSTIKSSLVVVLSSIFNSDKGVLKIRKWIKNQERKTQYYKNCKATLEKEKPAIVFCTNQRPVIGIAPIIAAQDLGIPTATFIFSWDNLPKATMVIETDYYFVWSEHMKNELMFYYPYINENQIFITGTPQFEKHVDETLLMSKEDFFRENNLDLQTKYICYSGDDITTSPNDPQYLQDTAEAIRKLSSIKVRYGIIFRRCPVDFSNRFDKVLENNNDIIKVIEPKWKKLGDVWNTILPTKEDFILQINTIKHTEMVVNLGSSMVFDYATQQKPCAYINYDVLNTEYPNWSVKNIYNFVHFRSMPNKNAVVWLNSPDEIAEKIEMALSNQKATVTAAKEWFEKINQHPIDQASQRMISSIEKITLK